MKTPEEIVRELDTALLRAMCAIYVASGHNPCFTAEAACEILPEIDRECMALDIYNTLMKRIGNTPLALADYKQGDVLESIR